MDRYEKLKKETNDEILLIPKFEQEMQQRNLESLKDNVEILTKELDNMEKK